MQHETWDKVITVHAVSGHRCCECGEVVFDAESYGRVVAVSDGFVRVLRKSNPPEVKVIREKLGLTQAAAGRISGGGINAFSRYERRGQAEHPDAQVAQTSEAPPGTDQRTR